MPMRNGINLNFCTATATPHSTAKSTLPILALAYVCVPMPTQFYLIFALLVAPPDRTGWRKRKKVEHFVASVSCCVELCLFRTFFPAITSAIHIFCFVSSFRYTHTRTSVLPTMGKRMSGVETRTHQQQQWQPKKPKTKIATYKSSRASMVKRGAKTKASEIEELKLGDAILHVSVE